MIAALYVAKGGAYWGLEGVDPWNEERDARLYAGPWPVVAHPPCERWGRYWFGGPSSPRRYEKGDDAGCFAAALASVRRWGGALEHPADSSAWAAHDLNKPPRSGGWVSADWCGGLTCCVEQGHYGHPARKPTWLYVNGIHPPPLKWGTSPGHDRRPLKERARTRGVVELLSKQQRQRTPSDFRDLLISFARGLRST